MTRCGPGVVVLGCLLLCGGLVAACGGETLPGVAEPPSETMSAGGRRIDPPAAAGALAPNLTLAAGDVVLSWLEPQAGDRHRLLVSRLEGGGWKTPAVVAEGDDFFANWADLPAVAETGDGSLVAHWLAKNAEDTYAYSIFLARSVDGGASWTGLGRLNDDDTPTEHGFVSYAAEAGGLRAFWLDGREMQAGGPMGLRTALISETVGASEVLDDRVCECCATDAASAAAGPLVAYRDRGGDEVRDTTIVRRAADGWTAPATAAVDGWTIAGCPVNGPAVAAAAERVALAWFTGAGETPRVKVALSTDGGATFSEPTLIDGEAPAGRVDVVLDGAGGAVISWLAVVGDAGSVRLRRVSADGRLGEPLEIAVTTAGRASGFPRLARVGEDVVLAWVDTLPEEGQRIRAGVVPLARLPRPGDLDAG